MRTSEIIEFLRDARYNYVIVTKRGLTLNWNGGDEPIIYGSRGEAEEDFNPDFDREIITLYDYVMRESSKTS